MYLAYYRTYLYGFLYLFVLCGYYILQFDISLKYVKNVTCFILLNINSERLLLLLLCVLRAPGVEQIGQRLHAIFV